jgi:2'-5' RNA ligase
LNDTLDAGICHRQSSGRNQASAAIIARMTFALEMFFDPAADTAVRQTWTQLEQAGISSLVTTSHRRHHPHITLAVAEQLAISSSTLDAIRELPGTELTLSMLGVFPGEQAVLFLGATATAGLLSAHAAIHATIEQASDGMWELYRPGQWVPHCTLAMRLNASELRTAITRLHPCSAIHARIAHINLVEVETGQITPLA